MSITHKRKILVVDDDAKVLRDVKRYMETQGFEVGIAEDGSSATALLDTMSPDLVVLDIAFPVEQHLKKQSVDGIEILRRVREASGVPVVMLSSTNVSAVKVMALKIGADDYLPKPFDMQELGARIDAVLRRSAEDRSDDKILNLRHLRMDPGERRVWKDDLPIEVTAVEFNLLYALARRPGHVFSREKLLQLAWGEQTYSVPKVVDVHIGHIRQKIENDPSNPTLIVTVRGIGYRLADEAA